MLNEFGRVIKFAYEKRKERDANKMRAQPGLKAKRRGSLSP